MRQEAPPAPLQVVLIDEEYDRFGGHHAAYDLPICDALLRRGIPVRLMAGSSLEVPAEAAAHIRPTFRTRLALHAALRGLPRRLALAAGALVGNAITWWDLVRRVGPALGPNSVVLLCRPLSRTRLAYLLWLGGRARRGRVRVAYVVHNEPDRYLARELALLARLAGPEGLLPIAHTPAVADRVRMAGGPRPAVLPLPFAPLATPAAPAAPEAVGPVRFAYLGIGHRSKGLDLVADAVEAVRDLLEQGRVSFAIQCYLPFEDPGSAELHRRTRALAERLPGVEVVARELDAAEYAAALGRAHVVLIPHRLEAYRLALSGVFSDAMGAGRPVVLASGGYMSELIRASGAGVTFDSGDAGSLAGAIRRAAADSAALLERAAAERARWAREQGPDAFVAGLLELVGEGRR